MFQVLKKLNPLSPRADYTGFPAIGGAVFVYRKYPMESWLYAGILKQREKTIGRAIVSA